MLGFQEEHGHLSARDGVVRTVVSVSAAARYPEIRQFLDPLGREVADMDVTEHRAHGRRRDEARAELAFQQKDSHLGPCHGGVHAVRGRISGGVAAGRDAIVEDRLDEGIERVADRHVGEAVADVHDPVQAGGIEDQVLRERRVPVAAGRAPATLMR